MNDSSSPCTKDFATRDQDTDEAGAMTLDPVQLALTQNRLDYITRQMGDVMVRTRAQPHLQSGP